MAVNNEHAPRAGTPLCVDLDGTLIRSDLLVESALALLAKKPRLLPLFWSQSPIVSKRWRETFPTVRPALSAATSAKSASAIQRRSSRLLSPLSRREKFPHPWKHATASISSASFGGSTAGHCHLRPCEDESRLISTSTSGAKVPRNI